MSAVQAGAPRSRDDFEVAIICALTLEANAVIALFDKLWDDDTHELRPSLSEDKNEYTFGRMGLHDVVVVVLPDMGKREASSAVAAIHPTFHNMQLCLVVGVCAIAPRAEDGKETLLGNVVISTYVIQSDLGRQYEDGFKRKDTLENNLEKPPQEIQRILERLKLEHHHEQLEQRMRSFVKRLESRKKSFTRIQGSNVITFTKTITPTCTGLRRRAVNAKKRMTRRITPVQRQSQLPVQIYAVTRASSFPV